MYYYNCTSMFHLVLIIYTLIYKYDIVHCEPKMIVNLIIPNHVPNLMKIVPKLQQFPYFNKIYIINTRSGDKEIIHGQLDEIKFGDKDVFHLLGWEEIGLSLLKKASGIAHTVVIEEGMYQINDLEKRIQFVKSDFAYKDLSVGREDIDELWKLDTGDQEVAEEFCSLHMKESFHSEDFLHDFLPYLKMIFASGQSDDFTSGIVYFDTHYIQLHKLAGRSMEKYLLRAGIRTLSAFDYIIKPHPADDITDKYEDFSKVCGSTEVPWEVTRLYERQKQPKILISLVPTGAILNDLFFWGEGEHVIFLNKIYERYGVGPVNYTRLNDFIDAMGNKAECIHFPETFTEMRKILNAITNHNEGINFADEQKKEDEEAIRVLAKEYYNAIKEQPDEMNCSTLLGKNNGQWIDLGRVPINTLNSYFELVFHTGEISGSNDLRWYVVKGRKVRIKIRKIEVFGKTGGRILSHEDIKILDGKKNNEGYYCFDSFDPVVEFKVSENCNTITIDADIIFDNQYESILETFHVKTRQYEKVNQKLLGDLQDRDNALNRITNQMKESEDRMKVLENRMKELENHIQDLIGQRTKLCSDIAERDCSLHRLMEQNENLAKDIHERDGLIQGLAEQGEALANEVNGRDHLIQDLIGQRETLMNDIAERDRLYQSVEEELAELKQSFSGRIKNALLQKKK